MKDFDFSIELDVRDYECDMQGIVNNAVYQNYLEHTRHQYLKSIGLNFSNLTARGIILVLISIELNYKLSLRSGDSFISGLSMLRISPLRFGFEQYIIRNPDKKVILTAKVIATCTNKKGQPKLPDELIKVWGKG